LYFSVRVEEPRHPCNPSPCGSNAICRERNSAGSCSCLPEYFGDPYTGCRPECILSSDCDRKKACINNKCKDPCAGTCGLNAKCYVVNHTPSCTCIEGYTGNALQACVPEPVQPSKHFMFLALSVFPLQKKKKKKKVSASNLNKLYTSSKTLLIYIKCNKFIFFILSIYYYTYLYDLKQSICTLPVFNIDFSYL
jgi:hypothetical protein